MSDPADGDLYRVLGVERTATGREIRRAYRRLARRHHPDVSSHPDGQRRFTRLTHAYEVLHDPAQRARYDRGLAPASSPAIGRSPRQPPISASDDRLPHRGTLELSPGEAAHLARHALFLHDARGRTLVVPAGTRQGDRIVLLYDGSPALLSVRVRART